MDRAWFEDFDGLYRQLLEHLVSAVERIVARAMQGMPLDTLGPLAGMLGGMSPPKHMPLEVCYRMLGLSSHASWEEVQKRYRELAKRLHPDKAGPETAHLFAMVTAAYEMIKRERGA